MKTVKEIHEYWKDPDKQNIPNNYIGKILRSQYLYELIKDLISKEQSILELGCNVGRNLNYLYNHGFNNLFGIEINTMAINRMEIEFPEMFLKSKIKNDSLENGLVNYANNDFDLIFSMAVLMHIHPDSEFIFSEITRICKKYLITIEYELLSRSWRIFHWDYSEIFTKLNMILIKELDCKPELFGFGYKLKIFQKV